MGLADPLCETRDRLVVHLQIFRKVLADVRARREKYSLDNYRLQAPIGILGTAL